MFEKEIEQKLRKERKEKERRENADDIKHLFIKVIHFAIG